MEEYICEICGRKTRKPYYAIIEGARLILCERCARHYKNAEPLFQVRKRVERAVSRSKPVRLRERNYEVVENYAELIRKARESRNMKIEDLAKAIAESESEIRKIERGELVPEIKVARKLEKFLGIELVHEITEEDLEKEEKLAKAQGNRESGITLGDIVVIKKR